MKRGGFSLVEVIFAASILALVLIGILASYISCMELAATAKNLTLATNSIQSKIEEIRDSPFDGIFDTYNNQTFTVNDQTLTLLDDIPAGSSGVIYVNNADPELLVITISVCWRQRGNRMVGEDLNLDGVEGPGEGNGDDIIESPAQIVTLITAR